MADKIGKEARSKNMSAIRSTHTQLEDNVSKALWRSGYRFRKNERKLKGKPDISIKKYKIAIFVDSCFWHFCGEHGHIPKSNTDFWIAKLEKNKKRDLETSLYYQTQGWNLLRIWEHELKEDFPGTVQKIADCIENAKQKETG